MVFKNPKESFGGVPPKPEKNDFHLDLIKLPARAFYGKTGAEAISLLDQFTAQAHALGAEPLVQVPVQGCTPEEAASWVRHCNFGQKKKVRFWAVGNEPDLFSPKDGLAPGPGSTGIYDVINDFRAFYNAMKKEDPGIFILGPELGAKYTEGDDDWLTPFVRYDGDIADMISIHRYGTLKSGALNPRAIEDVLRREPVFLQAVQDKISEERPVGSTSGGHGRKAVRRQ